MILGNNKKNKNKRKEQSGMSNDHQVGGPHPAPSKSVVEFLGKTLTSKLLPVGLDSALVNGWMRGLRKARWGTMKMLNSTI